MDEASPALSGFDSIATSRNAHSTFDIKKLLSFKIVDQIY
jgi:hypothetical protein